MIKDLLFYLLSATAIVSVLAMFFQKDPVKAAISMFVTLFTTGLIYMLLGLRFLGAIQIIIYSGAIMVLFVVALTALSSFPPALSSKMDFKIPALKNLLTAPVPLALALVLTALLFGPDVQWRSPFAVSLGDLTRSIFIKHAFQFEALSLLLFIAVVAAYVFARRTNER
ncbi:MAG: hypothetical protein COT17_02220 [Elusimicrobia bacterium CG08_land_8_20_14_0_20_51_18]|nr:MAG: hypothetical protein COT17_02220 [Elusimicrobia bacterium CG08_land_8_20_14_0_20_51_18]